MLTETDIEKACDFIRDNASEIAKAKAERIYIMETILDPAEIIEAAGVKRIKDIQKKTKKGRIKKWKGK